MDYFERYLVLLAKLSEPYQSSDKMQERQKRRRGFAESRLCRHEIFNQSMMHLI
jgi:hypothetical protein